MRKLTVLLFLFFVLVGCENKEEKTMVCQGTNGDIQVTNTIKYIGKTVTSVSYQDTMIVDDSLVSYISNYLDGYKETLKGLEGVVFSYEIEGSNVITTTTIDYSVANIDELVNAGLMDSIQSEKEKVIDYELTINYMKTLGLTCSEQ